MALTALVGFPQSGQVDLPSDVLFYQWDTDPIDPKPAVLALLLEIDDGSHQTASNRRIDVTETLRNGGTVVVALTLNGGSELSRPFGEWLCAKYDFQLIGVTDVWEMRATTSSLDIWFRRHVAHVAFATRDVGVLATAVDVGGENVGPASFLVPVGAGRLVVTQLRDNRAADKEIVAFIQGLPPMADYPPYLDELPVDEVGDLAGKLQAAQHEVDRLEDEISQRRELKRVMYVAGVELEAEVVGFLSDELAIPAEHVEGNKEDFWLTKGEPAERWCIGEVKGRERANVSRGDLSATDAHRDEAGLPPEYPALLVANTFAKATSLDVRDQAIHPNVADRARADNIVIVRTLDLIRLRRLVLGATSARDEFLGALRGLSGGWYEVNVDLVAALR